MGVNQQHIQSYCITTHHMTITLSSRHSQKRHPRTAGGRACPTQVPANRAHVYSDYLEKLRELVEVYEHLGGEPSCSEVRVYSHLIDPEMADADEIRDAKMEAREEYLAVMLLFKSDPKRYANLVVDIKNQHTRGQDGYPITLSAAYDMLTNYRNPSSSTRLHGQDSGLAFVQASNDHAHHDTRDGDSG